jgi:hypothetical protein
VTGFYNAVLLAGIHQFLFPDMNFFELFSGQVCIIMTTNDIYAMREDNNWLKYFEFNEIIVL